MCEYLCNAIDSSSKLYLKWYFKSPIIIIFVDIIIIIIIQELSLIFVEFKWLKCVWTAGLARELCK